MQILKLTQNIYSGGRPSFSTLKKLKQEGVTNICDLRGDVAVLKLPKLREKIMCKILGLKYIKEPLEFSKEFPKKDFFVSLQEKTQNSKTYFHCTNGKHRAGIVAHAMEILSGKKNVAQAINELVDNGYLNFKKRTRLKIKEFIAPKRKQNLEQNLIKTLDEFKKMFSENA